ncbi:MAG: DNA internalization-related competence protein ComEC/Rec2 [Thermodesulfobacteriota bacterium]
MQSRFLHLLSREKFFLVFLTGIWGFCYPLAAGFLFLVQAVLWTRSFKYFLLMLVTAAIGYAAAVAVFPEAPEGGTPRYMLNREKVRISGVVDEVCSRPGKRERMILRGVVVHSKTGRHELPAGMVVNWYEARSFILPGQKISFKSRIKPVHGLGNRGLWNSEFYWHKQNVYWRSYAVRDKSEVKIAGRGDFWSRARFKLIGSVSESFKHLRGGWSEEKFERVKGVALALLFGERFFLSEIFVDQVRRASLGHSLALSGMHLGMVVLMGWLLAGATGSLVPKVYLYLPRPKLTFCLAAPLCLAYIWLGQAPHSLVRSGLMFFFWGIFVWIGRSRNLVDALFSALAVIIIFDPLALFDLSLQLSALAVSGICVFYPYFLKLPARLPYFPLRPVPVYLGSLFMITLAVNIFLVPVQAWTFGYLSAHLYLNLLWLPLLGFFILPLAFLGLILSLFSPALAAIAFWGMGSAINPFADLLAFMDARFWLDPLVVIRPRWGQIAGYYFLVLSLVYYFCYQKYFKRAAMVMLSVCLVAFGPLLASRLDRSVRLQLMDVGQGQCVFIRSPEGRFSIIDGGGSWNLDYDLGKRVVAPALAWGRWPAAQNCILSHGDMDHLRGLFYPLAQTSIDTFWFNGIWPDKYDGHLLLRSVKKGKTDVRVLRKGDVVDLGSGLCLRVLYPPGFHDYKKSNNNSLVLRLCWNRRGLALIPGDIEDKGIEKLLAMDNELEAEVLVLPHHGSKSSFSPRFYRRVNPKLCLSSAGFLHYFRMPHKIVTDYLFQKQIPVMNTAQFGQIDVTWKNAETEMRISSYREPAQR